MSTELVLLRNWQLHPSEEYTFFVYDPQGDIFYFKTEAERDAHAQTVIDEYLCDGWDEAVKNVIAGVATHHTVMRDVEPRPRREDFKSDDEFSDAMEEFGSEDFAYNCTYNLALLSDPGEQPPK